MPPLAHNKGIPRIAASAQKIISKTDDPDSMQAHRDTNNGNIIEKTF